MAAAAAAAKVSTTAFEKESEEGIAVITGVSLGMKAGARRLSTGDIEPITGELWRLLRLSKPHMMLCSIYIGDTQGRLMRSYTRYGTVKPSTRKSPSATRPRKGLLHLTKSVRYRTPFLVNFGCMPSAFGSSDIVSLRTCELLLGKNEKVS